MTLFDSTQINLSLPTIFKSLSYKQILHNGREKNLMVTNKVLVVVVGDTTYAQYQFPCN